MRSAIFCIFFASCLICAVGANGDTIGNITATLDNNNPTAPVQPGELVNISDSALGISANVEAGQINWTLVKSISMVGYTPGNTFSTYSVDIADSITPGQTYNFNAVDDDPNGTNDMESLGGLNSDPSTAAAKLNQIEKLWAADFGLVAGSDTDAKAAALQVDIWQIIYGPDLVVSAVSGGSTDWEAYANSWMSDLASETATVNLFGLKRTSSAQDQAITDPPLAPMPMPFAGGLVLLGGFGLWNQRRRFFQSRSFMSYGYLRFQ
jgi:hypothetical protein